ncbi:MAG: ABC transporter permease [Planctomycetota bacterium]|jgi:ABC-2 type transport system permease protein
MEAIVKNRFIIFISELNKAAAFIKKDMKISVSYKLQFVFQFLQVFFGIAIIYFIGRMLGQSGSSSVLKGYGGDYFSFALVGLAINSYLRAGLVTITNDIRQIMNQGTLEAMCATPTNYSWLILCSSLWQFVFETIRVVCYFAVAILIFGMNLDNANWPAAILSMAITAPVFLMLGMISCSILVVIKKGDPVSWVFSSLGAILAGTMFPVSVLPDWMQKVSFCLPLTHSLEAARQSLLARAGIGQISVSLWALVIFIIILIPLTIAVNGICMKSAKKRGSFSTH